MSKSPSATTSKTGQDPDCKTEPDCMPDNPFLPDSLFNSSSDKIKAHCGLFIAFCCAFRIAGMYYNGEVVPDNRLCRCPR